VTANGSGEYELPTSGYVRFRPAEPYTVRDGKVWNPVQRSFTAMATRPPYGLDTQVVVVAMADLDFSAIDDDVRDYIYARARHDFARDVLRYAAAVETTAQRADEAKDRYLRSVGHVFVGEVSSDAGEARIVDQVMATIGFTLLPESQDASVRDNVARRILEEVRMRMREILSMRLSWNLREIDLEPDPTTGEVALAVPSDETEVLTWYLPNRYGDKSGIIYDRSLNTTELGRTITVRASVHLPINDWPQPYQNWLRDAVAADCHALGSVGRDELVQRRAVSRDNALNSSPPSLQNRTAMMGIVTATRTSRGIPPEYSR
jgi:hypothetical protein